MPAGNYHWQRLNPLPQQPWADPIPCLVWPAGVKAALETLTAKLYKERCDLAAKLTEAQFTEALCQAIACGDFHQLVRVDDGAQTVIYVPYYEQSRLKARIRELEERLKYFEDVFKNAPCVEPPLCHE